MRIAVPASAATSAATHVETIRLIAVQVAIQKHISVRKKDKNVSLFGDISKVINQYAINAPLGVLHVYQQLTASPVFKIMRRMMKVPALNNPNPGFYS